MLIIPRVSRYRINAGFTIPELIAALTVVSVLAAVAAPRFLTRTEFDVFGAAEQTRAALRFAQKSAIAKRRQVCVAIDSAGLNLSYGANFGDACVQQDCASLPTPANCLVNPATGKGYSLPATRGVSSSTASFSFNALGRPSAAQSLTLSGGGLTKAIVVEAETGYVH